MEAGLYVAISGQMAMQRRLDTIANNVANASTPGFRAENVTFESVISAAGRNAIAFAGTGTASFSRSFGPLVQTGNSLDLAVQGDGYLAISTPTGTSYTRDGRLQIAVSGELQTVGGHAVLDVGGGAIQLNPSLGPLSISRSGAITQNGTTIAVIGLFRISDQAGIRRGDGAGLISDRPAQPIEEFGTVGIVQGYVESANVNAVIEMSRLMSVARSFEALSTAMDMSDRKLSDAIRTLGSGR